MIVALIRLTKKWHLLLYILFFLNGMSQNKPLEFSDIKNWPSLGFPLISCSGQYAAYVISSNEGKHNRLCVRSFKKDDAFDIENVKDYNFAMDSRHLLYSLEGQDALIILDLKNRNRRQIDSVQSYQFITDKPNDWVVIRKNGLLGRVVALNLKNNKFFEYDSITKIHLLENGNSIIVEGKEQSLNASSVTLQYINFKDGIPKTIWTGKTIHSFDFNKRTLQFCILDKDLSGADCLDVYEINNFSAKFLYKRRLDDLNLIFDRIKGTSDDSRFLLFYARRSSDDTGYKMDTTYRNVRIWSYLDQQLKTVREQNKGNIHSYLYAMSLIDGATFRIEENGEQATEIGNMRYLIRKQEGDCHLSEFNWNRACNTKYYILSTEGFKRTHIPELDGQNAFLSPEKKYLLYYDSRLRSYCVYNIAANSAYSITSDIEGATWDYYFNKGVLRRIAGWLPGDQGVLLYDTYDLYLFDPTGKRKGKCLTGNIGKKTKTVFALTFDESIVRSFGNGNELLLTALNTVNKDNGFFKVTLSGDLTRLTMGPYIYDVSQVKAGTDFPPAECNFMPKQAQFGHVYIIKRTSATEFGNLYMTKDFKSFKKISDLHPHRGFNWYTSELHSWPSIDSTVIQAILYKPFDFDSTKKYPLIFHYYDRKSDGLHAYITPDALYYGCSINIPYYVSRGYLIALVDIHFKTGYAGQSALRSLESAANYFGKFKHVDTARLGIEGFSFGGYLTYYLVSHSKKFAAASSGAGITDLISQFGTLNSDIYPQHELSQYRIGKMLWERPDLFVENSPVMKSNDIQTPLLMMNTTHDGGVSIRQSIELFTALRRQGKKVWLLEYLEGDHGVGGEDAFDYCLRQLQFFDHYLKGKAMPDWMTKEN